MISGMILFLLAYKKNVHEVQIKMAPNSNPWPPSQVCKDDHHLLNCQEGVPPLQAWWDHPPLVQEYRQGHFSLIISDGIPELQFGIHIDLSYDLQPEHHLPPGQPSSYQPHSVRRRGPARQSRDRKHVGKILNGSKIYKGNPEKYFGKIRWQDIYIFSPENNCFSNVFFRFSFVYFRPIQDFTNML